MWKTSAWHFHPFRYCTSKSTHHTYLSGRQFAKLSKILFPFYQIFKKKIKRKKKEEKEYKKMGEKGRGHYNYRALDSLNKHWWVMGFEGRGEERRGGYGFDLRGWLGVSQRWKRVTFLGFWGVKNKPCSTLKVTIHPNSPALSVAINLIHPTLPTTALS